jgi:hypothetical protein
LLIPFSSLPLAILFNFSTSLYSSHLPIVFHKMISLLFSCSLLPYLFFTPFFATSQLHSLVY